MNIVTTLRLNEPFPKKAVQRYDKKIKNWYWTGGIFFSFCVKCTSSFLRKCLRGFPLVG